MPFGTVPVCSLHRDYPFLGTTARCAIGVDFLYSKIPLEVKIPSASSHPRTAFNSMAIATFDPNRPNFTPYGFTCLRWQASRTARPDRHNEVELNLLESGSLTYLVGGH